MIQSISFAFHDVITGTYITYHRCRVGITLYHCLYWYMRCELFGVDKIQCYLNSLSESKIWQEWNWWVWHDGVDRCFDRCESIDVSTDAHYSHLLTSDLSNVIQLTHTKTLQQPSHTQPHPPTYTHTFTKKHQQQSRSLKQKVTSSPSPTKKWALLLLLLLCTTPFHPPR